MMVVFCRALADTVTYHSLDVSEYAGRVVTCPEFSTSTEDNVECVCLAGYYSSGSSCGACQVGKFKDSVGNETCSDCRDHSTSLVASVSEDDCLCLEGFTLNGVICQACAVGKYKQYVGLAACSDCPSYTTTLLTGSDMLTDCKCEVGYTGPDGQECVECESNTFKNETGSGACYGCPEHSTTEITLGLFTEIEACKCQAGFSGPDGGSCVACGPGTFKGHVGSEACAPCPANENSLQAAEVCLCDPRYFRALPSSAYSLGYESGSYAIAGVVRPTLEVARGVSTSISWPSGHPLIVSTAEIWQQTETGYLTYVTVDHTSMTTTVTVPASFTGSTLYYFCGRHQGMGIGQISVTSGVCEVCAENSFKDTLGDAACTPCHSNSHSAAGSVACTCDPGYWGDASCTACPPDHYCDGTGAMYACDEHSTSPMYSTSEDDCTCVSGFEKLVPRYVLAASCDGCDAAECSVACADAGLVCDENAQLWTEFTSHETYALAFAEVGISCYDADGNLQMTQGSLLSAPSFANGECIAPDWLIINWSCRSSSRNKHQLCYCTTGT